MQPGRAGVVLVNAGTELGAEGGCRNSTLKMRRVSGRVLNSSSHVPAAPAFVSPSILPEQMLVIVNRHWTGRVHELEAVS
jgi:hypothetical protein